MSLSKVLWQNLYGVPQLLSASSGIHSSLELFTSLECKKFLNSWQVSPREQTCGNKLVCILTCQMSTQGGGQHRSAIGNIGTCQASLDCRQVTPQL
jgi:hypothetical protein